MLNKLDFCRQKRGLTILRNRDFQEKALKHSWGKEEFRGNRTFGEWGFTQVLRKVSTRLGNSHFDSNVQTE
uniref:NADAR domain-containing protein n=1 Tax=Romanomermis culicivorax TaxID=13658 RepID=A0A915LCL4_ROMCU